MAYYLDKTQDEIKHISVSQEDKELLLKDLCARLPYETQVYAQNANDWYDSEICTTVIEDCINDEYVVKPYLFPLPNITDEQLKEVNEVLKKDLVRIHDESTPERKIPVYPQTWCNVQDWYNKNHFDYRGLIERGLAIDASELNIY